MRLESTGQYSPTLNQAARHRLSPAEPNVTCPMVDKGCGCANFLLHMIGQRVSTSLTIWFLISLQYLLFELQMLHVKFAASLLLIYLVFSSLYVGTSVVPLARYIHI